MRQRHGDSGVLMALCYHLGMLSALWYVLLVLYSAYWLVLLTLVAFKGKL